MTIPAASEPLAAGACTNAAQGGAEGVEEAKKLAASAGSSWRPAFPAEEYAARQRTVRSAMEKQGLSVHVASDPANMNYLTGYDGWSFYVPQCVLIGVAADSPVLFVGRDMDADGALRTTHLTRDHIFGYDESLVQRADRHPMEFVADTIVTKLSQLVLAPLSGGSARVGCETESNFFSVRAHRALDDRLRAVTSMQVELVDAPLLVNRVRMVKSPLELAMLRRAAALADKVMKHALEVAAVGVPQAEVAAAVADTQAAGEPGAGFSCIAPIIVSGVDASCAHLTWSDAPLQAGQGTFLELSGTVNRYCVPIARTLFLGVPPQHFREADAAVGASLQLAVAASVPGALCRDVWRAFIAELRRHGFDKKSRLGYSIGLGYPPDWGENTLSVREDDCTELLPGMVLHLIAGLWQDGWGYEMSEVLVITADGPPEQLHQTPRHLFVKGADERPPAKRARCPA